MRKKLKVVLKKDVKDLGSFGEIKEVAAGYARNFLIPKGYALYLKDLRTKEILKRKEQIEKAKEEEARQLKEIAQKLSNVVLKFKVKTDEKGKLFGSVGPKQIIEKIEKDYKIKLDKKQIEVEAIKSIGEKEVLVKFGSDVSSKLKVVIESENTQKAKVNNKASSDEANA